MPIPALTGISTKAFLRLAVVSFLGAIIAVRLMASYNELRGRANAPLPMHSLGKMPVLQIELAPTEADLKAVLMAGDVSRNLSDVRSGTRLDTLLFIPSYSLLLFSLGLLLSRAEPRWAQIALGLALFAVPAIAVGDWTENFGIVRTLDHIESDHAPHPGDAWNISTPSLIKWTLLVFVTLTYGVIALRHPNLWRVPVGLLLLGVGGTFGLTLVRYASERW